MYYHERKSKQQWVHKVKHQIRVLISS